MHLRFMPRRVAPPATSGSGGRFLGDASGYRAPAGDWLPPLLALCARIDSPGPGLRERLLRAAAAADWDRLPALAEAHGLVPLLLEHLQGAGIAMPGPAHWQLASYLVQHAHACRVRERVLVEILLLYREAGIETLLLKGAALAHLIYPRPTLRPMRDIDLLVPGADAERAQAALAEIGFRPPPSPMHGLGPTHHHLAAVTRCVEGVSISVEVHHGLKLRNERRPTARFEDFADRAQSLVVNGVGAHTLGPEDMLWHVYRHAFNATSREPLRLIWVADLRGLVVRWRDRIDWVRVGREHPAVVRVLPVVHGLAPWPACVAARLGLPQADRPGDESARRVFDGWPRVPLSRRRSKSLRRVIAGTLFPPSWWLRLCYGRGTTRLEYARAWLAHLRMLAAAVRHDARKHAGRLAARPARRAGPGTVPGTARPARQHGGAGLEPCGPP